MYSSHSTSLQEKEMSLSNSAPSLGEMSVVFGADGRVAVTNDSTLLIDSSLLVCAVRILQ